MKKVLVIGGSYFAGRVFIEELVKNKEVDIHLFNRGRISLGIDGVTEHHGNREDSVQIRSAIPEEDWDAVVDFCAYTPSHIELMLNNLPGKIKQYLFISTTSVYENSWNLPLREDTAKVSRPQPELGEMASYGYDKCCAEQTLMQACKASEIFYTVLRPAIIYGFYNYAPREQYFFDLLRDGKPFVLPEPNLALFNFIWVVDMARMIIQCIGEKKTFNQDFNLSSDELVSYPRIVEVLEKITNKKIKVVSKSIEEINQERIPLPFPLDMHLIYSGSKLRRMLNFDYTPLTTGMSETFSYYQMVQKNLKKHQ